MRSDNYVIKYFLNFYANSRGKRHAVNNVRVYKNFNNGNPTDLVIEIESRRQDVILKELRPYTTKKQREVLKSYGMKWGDPIRVLSDGTYFL